MGMLCRITPSQLQDQPQSLADFPASDYSMMRYEARACGVRS
jgi:hypothetical protein